MFLVPIDNKVLQTPLQIQVPRARHAFRYRRKWKTEWDVNLSFTVEAHTLTLIPWYYTELVEDYTPQAGDLIITI